METETGRPNDLTPSEVVLLNGERFAARASELRTLMPHIIIGGGMAVGSIVLGFVVGWGRVFTDLGVATAVLSLAVPALIIGAIGYFTVLR